MVDDDKLDVSPSSRKHTYSQRMGTAGIVNLVSSDEEEVVRKRRRLHSPEHSTDPKTPIQNDYVGNSDRHNNNTNNKEENDHDEDDEELQVVSCTRARASKGSQGRPSYIPDPSTDVKDGTQKRLRLSSASEAPTTRQANGNLVDGFTEGTATDQLEVVESRSGVQPLKDYPHFRFQCVLKAFKRQRANRKQLFCEKCFCYVCDVPAESCGQWPDHCKATDTGSQWRASRQAKLNDRRKLDIDPAQRGTHFARAAAPVVVENLGSGSDSEGDGMSSDSVEGVQWFEAVDQNGIEVKSLVIGSVMNDASCFSMGTMSKLLDGSELRTSTRRHTASTFDVCTTKLV